MTRKIAVCVSIIGVLISLAGLIFMFLSDKKFDLGMTMILLANICLLLSNIANMTIISSNKELLKKTLNKANIPNLLFI